MVEGTLTKDCNIVAVCKKDEEMKLKDGQYQMAIDDSLLVCFSVTNKITKECQDNASNKRNYDVFLKKYKKFASIGDLRLACSTKDINIIEQLQQRVPCVGCRRGVEDFVHKAGSLPHQMFDSLQMCIKEGTISVSDKFLSSPRKLYQLFYQVRPKLTEKLEANVLSGKKNKRCVFHSLNMLKPNEYSASKNKHSMKNTGGTNVIDVWDEMCKDCHNEITRLECKGILDTMEFYLKKHRFCSECKSKVQRAYHMLTGDVDQDKEPGYCQAIFEGLKYCKSIENDKNSKSNKNGTHGDNKEFNHVHVCSERNFVVHMLTLADNEISGGRKERHAKTIDIAQEEVCTCLSLFLYYRLHKVWHTKLTFEQTWLTVLLLSIELIMQNFETCVEQKCGVGREERFFEDLKKVEEQKNLKTEKKRLKRKQNKQKKKREQKELGDQKSEMGDGNHQHTPDENDMDDVDERFSQHSCAKQLETEKGEFNFFLLQMLQNGGGGDECECAHDGEEQENQLTADEIRDFEQNRPKIDAERVKLRDKLRHDFNNYLANNNSNNSSG